MRSRDEKPGKTRQDDAAEALQALHSDWGGDWEIGCVAGQWGAARRDGTGQVLTRASADGLAMTLRISR